MSCFCTAKRGFSWYFGHLSGVGTKLSREPLAVEDRAKRQSKALHKPHPKHLSELNINDTCEVKVRSNGEISRVDVWGPGNRVCRFSVLKQSWNVPYAWIMYAMIIDCMLRKGQGQGQVPALWWYLIPPSVRTCDWCGRTGLGTILPTSSSDLNARDLLQHQLKMRSNRYQTAWLNG